jgi:hypothetical protein
VCVESCGEAETCTVGYPDGGVGATVWHPSVGKGGGYAITGEEASVEKLKKKKLVNKFEKEFWRFFFSWIHLVTRVSKE